MIILEKVIFDTNRLYNKQGTSFFAKNICKLESFQQVSEIIIPDIVIAELENKYKRDFEEEKEKFVKTILNSFLNHDADILSPEEKISQLKENEVIKNTVIELKDSSVLFKMKELALKKEPPFKKNVKEDPGFKDAYIYFTVLEYLQTCTDKYIFVCTEDITLKEALEKHQNIKVIKDFEEFNEHRISIFCDEYFISKLQENINENIKKENILDFWINIKGNQILLIKIKDEEFVVEVDNREIQNFVNKSEYEHNIKALMNSNDFGNTHQIIKILSDYINYFSDEEIEEMFNAIFENFQIKGAFGYGVKEFYGKLFEAKKETLEPDLKEKLEKLFV